MLSSVVLFIFSSLISLVLIGVELLLLFLLLILLFIGVKEERGVWN